MTTTLEPPAPGPAAFRRDAVTVLQAQLHGMDRLHVVRHAVEAAHDAVHRSREAQLDARRRLDVVRRQQEALIARAQEQLVSCRRLADRDRPQVLLAHRNDWFRGKVGDRLSELHCDLVVVETGADVVGAAAADQPDLVVVEEQLPMMQGDEVLRLVRELAPESRIAVQALDERRVAGLLEQGASAVFTRRVPPVEVADAALDLLQGA